MSLASIFLSDPDQNVGRNRDSKGHSDEALEMQNVLLDNGGMSILFILCSCSRISWKLEFASNDIGYLTEAVSK